MSPSTERPDTPLAAAPVLDATGSEPSLDWPNGEYSVSVAGARGQWQVQHNILGADGITDLIEAGHAMFAAEARCPTNTVQPFGAQPEPDHGTPLRRIDDPRARVRGPWDRGDHGLRPVNGRSSK